MNWVRVLILLALGLFTTATIVAVAGIIDADAIRKKIIQNIKKKKYKNKAGEQIEVLGGVIKEMCKDKKSVKLDVLDSYNNVVAEETYKGDSVSADLKEGEIIYVNE